MAFPTTLYTEGAVAGYNPPHVSSADNTYAIIFNNDSDVEEHIQALKATDPADSFTEQDAAGHPINVSGATPSVLSTVQSGDVIHVAWADTNLYRYAQFNMATDNWDVTSQSIESVGANPPAEFWISIGVRSDGDVIVVYNGETDGVKGDEKERVDVNVRTGSTWSGPTSLDAGGDIHYGNPNVVKGPLTDDMHIVWQETDNATPDPPTSWEDMEARTLDSADTLSTLTRNPGANSNNRQLGMPHAIAWDDSGTQRIGVIFIRDVANTARQYIGGVEDGSNNIDLSTIVVDLDNSSPNPWAPNEHAIMSLAHDVKTGFIHQLYSGGGSGGGGDQDFYHAFSTNVGDTFSTPVEEINGITMNWLSATIYVRNLDTVIAFTYDDLGDQKYNEILLSRGHRNVALMVPPAKIGARYY
jgi:hypothetical protein